MKKIYAFLCALLVLCMLSLGAVSLVDKDPTFSRVEKRELPGFPQITFSSLIDGSFGKELLNYYAETFPGREYMAVESYEMNRFFAPSFFSQEDLDAVLNGLEKDTLPHTDK